MVKRLSGDEIPLVSVIMPNFNYAIYLGDAIDSVLRQTYRNLELIIVDNWSTDESQDIVQRYPDPRIKFIRFANGGSIAASRNKGIAESSGEIIAFLDSDDLWSERKLESCIGSFRRGFDVVHHNLRFLDGEGRLGWRIARGRDLGKTTLSNLLSKGNGILQSSAMVRKSTVASLGGLDESSDVVGCEDYLLWLRAAEMGAKFRFLSKVLGAYRIHQASVSRKNMTSATRAVLSRVEAPPSLGHGNRVLAQLDYVEALFFYSNGTDSTQYRSQLLFVIAHGAWKFRIRACYMLVSGPFHNKRVRSR